jgi:hypothetical protein
MNPDLHRPLLPQTRLCNPYIHVWWQVELVACTTSGHSTQTPGFLRTESLRLLSCRFLQASDVQGAGLLLTRAFAATPEAVKLDEAV